MNRSTNNLTVKTARKSFGLKHDWYDYSIYGLMATAVIAIFAGFAGM